MKTPLVALWALSSLFACAGATFQGSTFKNGLTQYRIGELSADWRRIDVGDANLAFRHREGGTLLANSMCGADHIEDVPLDVLTNQLLFGVEERREIERKELTLDDRAALRTHLVGSLDGVPVELDLVVIKKDGCTYDFQLITGPAEYAARRPEFEAFFLGFHRVKGDG